MNYDYSKARNKVQLEIVFRSWRDSKFFSLQTEGIKKFMINVSNFLYLLQLIEFGIGIFLSKKSKLFLGKGTSNFIFVCFFCGSVVFIEMFVICSVKNLLFFQKKGAHSIFVLVGSETCKLCKCNKLFPHTLFNKAQFRNRSNFSGWLQIVVTQYLNWKENHQKRCENNIYVALNFRCFSTFPLTFAEPFTVFLFTASERHSTLQNPTLNLYESKIMLLSMLINEHLLVNY